MGRSRIEDDHGAPYLSHRFIGCVPGCHRWGLGGVTVTIRVASYASESVAREQRERMVARGLDVEPIHLARNGRYEFDYAGSVSPRATETWDQFRSSSLAESEARSNARRREASAWLDAHKTK